MTEEFVEGQFYGAVAMPSGYKVHAVRWHRVLKFSVDYHGSFRALCGIRGGSGYGGHMMIRNKSVDCGKCLELKAKDND